ncbi:MAG: nitroreductase family protein [SAR202 cluster bacterium]|nr:nitroreductase family protein [SAR202 cluster bacterium]
MNKKSQAYIHLINLKQKEMIDISKDFFNKIKTRRTIRDFSSKDIPIKILENAIKAAGRAPSGANQQPWHFVIVSNKKIKKSIRNAAEKEEQAFYTKRAPEEWLNALKHIGTDANKPHLEKAPYLIIVFAERYSVNEKSEKIKNYYVSESVGISTGFLITALHFAGLVTLTHTPSPMKFLNKILNRPSNESAYLIIAVGYPEDDATVPVISKKQLSEFLTKFT